MACRCRNMSRKSENKYKTKTLCICWLLLLIYLWPPRFCSGAGNKRQWLSDEFPDTVTVSVGLLVAELHAAWTYYLIGLHRLHFNAYTMIRCNPVLILFHKSVPSDNCRQSSQIDTIRYDTIRYDTRPAFAKISNATPPVPSDKSNNNLPAA
jgi:hypothetical protein